jgi:3-isopropylmalate/(R)-2-methylmalate dehydratase large subunit
MGMTLAEKILARASGRASVRPGDVLYPQPELVIVHDSYIETAHKQLTELGYRSITRPDRVMFVTDHNVVYTTPKAIAQGMANRRIAAQWQVGHFFDVGRGGHGHIFPMEAGLVTPGMFLFAYDMHCTNFGAIGAFAQRAGPDITAVLGTGTNWTVVPPTLRIELHGEYAPGVHSRDLGFWLSAQLTGGKLGVEYDYRVVEFAGPAVDGMSVALRVALCNTLTEIGVANVVFPPPAGASERYPAAVQSDADAQFENIVRLELAEVTPQVSLPGGPDRAVRVDAVVGQRIDHAYVGACGSGMYEDFLIVADLLRGRRVADHVRFFVVPGTVAIAQRLAAEGLSNLFMQAGAMLLPAGCGPCAGGVGGPLGPGEVSISTAATNGAGRMGAKDALCYLGSPATVAASAVAGAITDPRGLGLARSEGAR